MSGQDKYEPVSNRPDFSRIEGKVLSFWKEFDVFEQSLAARRGGREFVFYDGPPFATGLPHYGHLLAGTIKDVVPRYQTMRGHYVERRFGWDCHGLPVECEVEQDLGISGKGDIEKLGVDVFNERCRGIVLRHTEQWRDIVTRMGRWVDFDRDYKTMDPAYMESIWWVFRALWDRGHVYAGKKILPYCPRCATPLSNFEANDGYVDVKDPAITVRFKLRDEDNAYIMAWTTTPWTLPSNMALAVGAEIRYVRVRDDNAVYYMAADRVDVYYPDDAGAREMTELPGSELVGRRYEPLFPYFEARADEGAFRIVAADFVSTGEGTGVVHMAPGFGEDDYALGQAEGIPSVCPVDDEGRFTAEVADYVGRSVKETDDDIIARLKREGSLVHRTTVLHSYPHCWRCDTPLIYRAVSTWFVRVEAFKDRLVELNRGVHWVPEHLRDGRFGKWLEGARDWAISRNRYWGTPLPVWQSEDGQETLCIGSIEELERLSGRTVSDLHKHHVDDILIPSQEGRGMLRRIPEVLDCWFESGAMPYAQAHYPFENKEHFEAHFPADFIAEGLDQTRGWFYTLMVLSVALFDKPAFEHVVVNGLILAEDGRKMSKRLKNYPDPVYMLDTYGADAIRLYMLDSPVVRAEGLRFSEEGVKQVLRHILIPLWNAYSFFVTYANIDEWRATEEQPDDSPNVLDRWIRSSLEGLAEGVITAMDAYDLKGAVRPFVAFTEDLTNWYIRRSRRRFWKSKDDADKACAYATLHHVLLELSRIAAPFVPFVSETIYRNLRLADMPMSVHLCDFPVPDGSARDTELEGKMRDVMTVVKLGRGLRSEHTLKVRQPLAALHVVSADGHMLERIAELEGSILEELNVKRLVFSGDEGELALHVAKPNFRRLGPRFGAQVKVVAAAIGEMDEVALARLATEGRVTLETDAGQIEIGQEDVVVERRPKPGLVVASEGAWIVALETELDDALVAEGLARELINKVQNMRKLAGFEVTQRIHMEIHADAAVQAALEAHAGYVMTETLCLEYQSVPERLPEAEEWDLNGHACSLRLVPVPDGE